ncbi:MAG: hypothetical protein GXO89_04930 [Chlorobi bacterium]|nr:hypothetical protein [Chlorobiota bacterium]
MLISFFKSSYLIQYGLLVVLAVLLWFGAFTHPVNHGFIANSYLSPAFNLISSIAVPGSILGIIIAFLLNLFIAFSLNFSLIRNDLTPTNSLIPALVYIVASSVSIRVMGLNPVLFSSLLLIISFHNLLGIYSEEDAFDKVFNAGFFIGLASAFYFPAIFFFLFIWFTFVVFRLQNWREWVIAFLGLVTPYLFIFTWFFLNDELTGLLISYQEYFTSISFFNFQLDMGWGSFLIFGIMALMVLVGIFRVMAGINEKTILVRKKTWAIMWFTIMALLVFFISPPSEFYGLGLLTISISAFIAIAFSYIRRLFWFEIAFGIFIIMIVLNNVFGSA